LNLRLTRFRDIVLGTTGASPTTHATEIGIELLVETGGVLYGTVEFIAWV